MEDTKKVKIYDTNKTHKPHRSKISGLKTVIANSKNDEIVIGTFGKRNETILEKKFEYSSGHEKESLVEESSFKNISVEGNDILINPLKEDVKPFAASKPLLENVKESQPKEIRKDYLNIKDRLEMEFWGKTYPYDNLHVQIAYNLLDIKKILGLQVNNVIFSFGNLQQGSFMLNNSVYDFIGSLSSNISYESYGTTKQFKDKDTLKTFIKKLMPYNFYFDNVLLDYDKDEKDETIKEQTFAHNLDVLRIVSVLRQFSSHESDNSNLSCLFSSQSAFDDNGVAHELFEKRLESFNNDFLNNNKQVFYYLFKLFPKEDKNTLIKEYYNYVLFKGDKNLGISIKKIKEVIIRKIRIEETKFVNDEAQNKLAKFYPLFNFYLYRYYSSRPALVEEYVDKLRTKSDPSDKTNVDKLRTKSDLSDKIYEELARKFTVSNPTYFKSLIDLNDEFYSQFSDKNNTKSSNQENKKHVKEADISSFDISILSHPSVLPLHEYLYVLSKFMDGKEVNELFTSLTNKFENISSLIAVAKQMDIWEPFTNEFDLLNTNEFQELAEKFRFLNSVCSMKRKLKKTSPEQGDKVRSRIYCDAINMFLSDGFVKPKENENDVSQILLDKLLKKKKENKSRNFLINNVIKNRRFVYLCKYFNPTSCSKVIKNKKITKFLLMREDMPLSIIEKYYKSLNPEVKTIMTREAMVNFLVDNLTKVNMDYIFEYEKNPKMYNSEGPKKLISLYLLLIYVFVKGLVHVNSIFFLAFAALERDATYHNINIKKNYLALTDSDTFKNKVKKRYQYILDINEKDLKLFYEDSESSNSMFIEFRNAVEHLNICQSFINYIDKINFITSYYDAYVFCLQSYLADTINPVSDKLNLKANLDEHKCYNKNFMKVLCLPFFYKLSTYKNLTIADLFNDKYEEAHLLKKEHAGELLD